MLQRNVKKVEALTLERINVLLVEHAITAKIDDGDKLRVDCTEMKNSLTTLTRTKCLTGQTRRICAERRWVENACCAGAVETTH